MTKLEYIIENNYSNIEEKDLVLNKEEKTKKEKFEIFDLKIKEKIKKIKLLNIKEIIFDNCTNYFIELTLSMVKSDLDLLKIKKCAKDRFNLNNILSLNILHFYLFDTPIFIDSKKSFPKFNFNNLSLRINSLEHYCSENNINFNKTIELILELISNSEITQNIIFEMDTLSVIFKFLIHKKMKKIEFKSYNERLVKINKSKIFYIKGLEDKNIKIKKNIINNSLDIYEYNLNNVNSENDLFDYDIDYVSFFNNNNKIKYIIFEKNIVNNSEEKLEKNRMNINDLKTQTLINIIHLNNMSYKIDFITLENAILDKNFNSFSHLLLIYYNYYNQLKEKSEITKKDYFNIIYYIKYLNSINNILSHILKNDFKITFIINNIKEQKEFYILLCIYKWISNINNNNNIIHKKIKEEKEIIKLYYNEEIINIVEKHFIKRKNEQNKEIYNIINYYYLSKEEKELFEDYENNCRKKEIIFEKYIFLIDYNNNNEDFWNIF